MKLQVLGPEGAKCKYMAAAVEASARRQGIAYELERVTDLSRFAGFSGLLTPALVVNGRLKASGRIPSEAELDRLLKASIS